MPFRTVHIRSIENTRSKEFNFMTSFLKTLHILFGVDLGFFAHKSLKSRLILKIIMIVHCTVLGVFLWIEICDNDFNLGMAWTLVYYLEYVLTVLLLSLSKRGTTLMNLLESLKEIDVKFQADFSRNHIELKFILTLFFIFLERFVIISFYSLTGGIDFWWKSKLDFYVFAFLTPCADVSLFCYSFVFYSLYLRLEKLTLMFETNDNFDYMQHLYKEIVDNVEKYKRGFDSVYMLLLLCNVPQVMVTIYFSLIEWQNNADLVTFLGISVEYFYLLELFALTIAPALTAEMLTTQAEEIKKILHDKMLLRGVQHKDSLSRFIMYVEARPCRFRVWKLVPLSADLFGMVLSFCVTYLIVILQFTNLQINN